MYFVQEGVVGIGYYAYQQGMSQGGETSSGSMIKDKPSCLKMGVFIHEGAFICDYYVCCNKRSEFVYMASGPKAVCGFTLKQSFLHKHIFKKYPEEAQEMKSQSLIRYRENVRKRLIKHRDAHLKEANKKSTYKTIEIKEKGQSPSLKGKLKEEQQPQSGKVDLGAILKTRVHEVQAEISKLQKSMHDFAEVSDCDLQNLYSNIALLKKNVQISLNRSGQDDPINEILD